jgi:hypothetical protein
MSNPVVPCIQTVVGWQPQVRAYWQGMGLTCLDPRCGCKAVLKALGSQANYGYPILKMLDWFSPVVHKKPYVYCMWMAGYVPLETV